MATREFICIDTSCGQIFAEIRIAQAPITAKNFMRYVDHELYARAVFYRTTRPDNDSRSHGIRIIQGGLGPEYEAAPPLPPIAHESTKLTGLSHVEGALSMARWEPGTAASEFFIVVERAPQLDYGGILNQDGQGFAVFGRVIDGMEVVRWINGLPIGTSSAIEYMRNQSLIPSVAMSVRRVTHIASRESAARRAVSE